MKPTSLKNGDRVLIKPALGVTQEVGTFIMRIAGKPNRPAHSIIRVDGFAGLNGPQDLGDTQFSDYDVSRRITLLE